MQWTELAENVGFSEAEPGRTRFARLETKAVQRPKFGAAPVSEVRTVLQTSLKLGRNPALKARRSEFATG